MAPAALDVKFFIPARDFEESLRFYMALGFEVNCQSEHVAELEFAEQRFFLQDFYVREFAENFMVQVIVSDANDWYEYVVNVKKGGEFPTIRVDPPKQEAGGSLVTYLWDPCGVLWHFTQPA